MINLNDCRLLLFGAMFFILAYSLTRNPCIGSNNTTKETTGQTCACNSNVPTVSNTATKNTMVAKEGKLARRKYAYKKKSKQVRPTKHIGFLKVHKAGSSTIQNMLFRFGIRYNLTFVLPHHLHYVLTRRDVLPVKKGRHYDIFACHTVFDPGLFDLLPEGSVNMAIVREPLKRMISAAYYYRDVMQKEYLMNISRDTLVPDLINHANLYDRGAFSRTKNSMGSDFGFSPMVSRRDTKMVQMYMTYLKRRFRLVLVADRFEESLVLMKRRLNWSVRDIIYLKSNSNPHPAVNLTKVEKNRFKEISFLDYEIYNTFSEIFTRAVEELGQEFQQEVTYVKTVQKIVSDFCRTAHNRTDKMVIPRSKWNDHFNVTFNDCVLMNLDNLAFVQKMKVRHLEMNGLNNINIA